MRSRLHSRLTWALLCVIALGSFSSCSSTTGKLGVPPDGEYKRSAEPVKDPSALPSVALWTHKGKAYFGSGPIAVGNRLIFPTSKGRLEYVDPNSGNRAAEAKAKYSLNTKPLFAAGRFFLITQYPRHRLQALDAQSGKRLWHRDFRVPIQAPINVEEELWVPVGDTIVALSLDKGDRKRVIVPGGDRWLTPTRGLGGFLLLGESGMMRNIDSTGTTQWQLELNAPCAETPVVYGTDILVVTADGKAIRVDGAGTEVWRQKLGDDYLYAPVTADSLVYIVGRNGKLWALALASGDSVWTQTLGAPGAGPPLVRGDWLAATSVDGKLWFLDRRGGQVRDSVVFDALIHHPPVWAFGRLYVVTADKRAHAFGIGP